jgi:hypothetical protein
VRACNDLTSFVEIQWHPVKCRMAIGLERERPLRTYGYLF